MIPMKLGFLEPKYMGDIDAGIATYSMIEGDVIDHEDFINQEIDSLNDSPDGIRVLAINVLSNGDHQIVRLALGRPEDLRIVPCDFLITETKGEEYGY
jgi:hypothetical protein